MNGDDIDRLVEDIRGEYGDSLRAIASYDVDDYRIEYLDDQVGESYTQEELDEIYEDLVMDSFTSPYYEDLFRGMGEARAVFRVFEEGSAAYIWLSEADRGVYVALDNEADPGVDTLVSFVESHCE